MLRVILPRTHRPSHSNEPKPGPCKFQHDESDSLIGDRHDPEQQRAHDIKPEVSGMEFPPHAALVQPVGRQHHQRAEDGDHLQQHG